MAIKLINLGFNNVIVSERIVAVLNSQSLPSKRLREEAIRKNKLVDATNGRKTRTILVTDSDHIVLSSLQPETVIQRIKEDKEK
ncbi:MAG: DUF370 domain-containing protein [Candidatus Omnitrophica bacterium]|nr:DUF370 domain-containing protein [Candidatus Omnitrophota bacterium]